MTLQNKFTLSKPSAEGFPSEEVICLMEEKAAFYNQKEFIKTDPILVPHQFTQKQDIEIAAFLVATIAWGNRKSIVANGMRLMQMMDQQPADFVMNFTDKDLAVFDGFVHRTFNNTDLLTFLYALKNIYNNHGGMEKVFHQGTMKGGSLKEGINHFRQVFFGVPHLERTCKHVSHPAQGSAAKRINMFLRWMIRDDNQGVDFGLWKLLAPSQLFCPLDVHSARVARKFRLLTRKQNDWKAVEELTEVLRGIDQLDPVRYDFALFGMGVFEN